MNGQILIGDAVEQLRLQPDESVNCCVTSPPYWGLRDYGVAGQLGLERTPQEYVENMVAVFREVKRVLRNDGTLWLNLGDSYAGSWGAQGRDDAMASRSVISARQIAGAQKKTRTGSIAAGSGLKPKNLVGIPWRVAFALQADGWYLRSEIIWHKPNAMPESVTDRPTKAHEQIFLLAKSEQYFYGINEVKEPLAMSSLERCAYPRYQNAKNRKDVNYGNPNTDAASRERMVKSKSRNKRTVWTVTTKPFKGAHFATFPMDLIEPCVLAGCPQGGTVLDPFFGAGTTGCVANKHGRKFVGIELNPTYAAMARERIEGTMFSYKGEGEN